MIWLTRFDGTRFVLNADLIELIEPTPDTVITLTNGHHFVVREAIEDILSQLINYRRASNGALGEGT